MNLNLLQNLWPTNLAPNRKQDVKIETVSIPRPQNNGDREQMESDKVHQAGSGIWDNIWRMNLPWNDKSEEQAKKANVNGVLKIKTVRIPRPENSGDREQMERGKVHKAGSGIWENIWQMNLPWNGQSREQAKKANVNAPVKIKTVRILRSENSGDREQMESRKVHQAGLGIWETIWQMNLPWNAKSEEQAKKANVNEPVKIETVRIPRSENSSDREQMRNRKFHQAGLGIWENIWQTNLSWNAKSEEQAKKSNVNEVVKIETISIPRPENNGDHEQMESGKVHQDGLGIWENSWRMNLPWNAKFDEQAKKANGNEVVKIETVSIPRPENNGDREQMERGTVHQDGLGIWENSWWMKLPWNAKSDEQAKKANVHEVVKIEPISMPRPENSGDLEQMESGQVHHDGLGIWENSWWMNLPWNAKSDKQAKKANVNEVEIVESGCAIPSFTPYIAKIPWHTGPRAFLAQLFPRYGNYCGPNWSSGKDRGALLWDKRPIDELDFCCYRHDIGYDTHDQAEMLKADIAFLDCLERTHINPKGNPRVAEAYKSMCITGLRNVLIPYRKQLLKQIHRGKTPATAVNGWNGRNDTVQRQ